MRTSVIIPVKDRAETVAGAIESALGQMGAEAMEIVVVDDGSGDGTPDVLAGFGDAIRVIRLEESRGVAHARNVGIEAARGAFVAFLDSDDLWLEGKLESQIPAMEADAHCGLSFTDYTVAEEDERGALADVAVRRFEEAAPDFRRLFRRNFTGTSTIAVRKACFDSVGMFDESRRNRFGLRDVASHRAAVGHETHPACAGAVSPAWSELDGAGPGGGSAFVSGRDGDLDEARAGRA